MLPQKEAASQETNERRRNAEEETKQGLLKFLGYAATQPDMESELDRAINNCHPNTLEWVFADETYQRWFKMSCSVLWISGSIGAGKSTLCSKLITSWRENRRKKGQPGNVAFFFCKLQKNPSILSSLAGQLLKMQQCITSDVLQIYKDWRPAGTQLDPESHKKDLLDLIRVLLGGLAEVFIVIDGLDELLEPKREDLLNNLKTLCQYSPGSIRKIKWVFSCREEKVFSDAFNNQKWFPDMEFFRLRSDRRSSKMDGDIYAFVSEELSNFLSTARSIDVKKFVGEIASRSEGCFLYARLLVEEIKRKTSPAEILDVLDQDWERGYEGLTSLYDDAYNKLKDTQSGNKCVE
jgi:hypothetical protein